MSRIPFGLKHTQVNINIMNKIFLVGLEEEEFFERVGALVKKEFKAVNEELLSEKFLSIAQVRTLFDPPLSRTSINKLKKLSILKEYRLLNKPLFKYSEVISAVKEIRKYTRVEPIIRCQEKRV